MRGHTPGPWIAGGLPTDPSGLLITSDDGTKYHRRVLLAQALVPMGLDSQHPVVQANARLIAAAPELLAALNGVLGFIEDLALLGGMTTNGGAQERLDAARSAIAKANGGQS